MRTYLLATLVMSVVTLVVYGWDKRQAGLARWRISERNLHLLALLGGWPGAILGQRWFRHKTQKRSFQVVFWLIVALHAAAVGWVFASQW